MTSTVLPTHWESAQEHAEALDGLTPAETQVWLDGQIESIAAQIERAVTRIVNGAFQAFALTAAGDPGAIDGISAAWSEFVEVDLAPRLGLLYRGAALSAYIGSPAPDPRKVPDLWDWWSRTVDDNALNYIAVAENRIVGVGDDLYDAVRDQIAPVVLGDQTIEQAKQAIEKKLQVSEFRADTIARTETLAAFNNGDQAGAQALGPYGPVEKMWLAAIDARTRPSHAEASGQVVAFDAAFHVGGVSMMFPHAPGAPAAEVVNCRCVCNHLFPGDLRPDGTQIPPRPAPAKAASKYPPGTKISDADLQAKVDAAYKANPKIKATPLTEQLRMDGHLVSGDRVKKALAKSKGGAAKGGPTHERGLQSKGERYDHKVGLDFFDEHDHPIRSSDMPDKWDARTPETAARHYTGGAYADINETLRGGGKHQIVDNLDQALKPPKQSIEVYRGTNMSARRSPNGNIEELQGKVLLDKAYLSTSGGEGGPAFGGNVGLRITVTPDGGRGAWVQDISKFAHEREYLVGRNQKLYVTAVRKPDHREAGWANTYEWIIDCETVSDEWAVENGLSNVWDSNTGAWLGA